MIVAKNITHDAEIKNRFLSCFGFFKPLIRAAIANTDIAHADNRSITGINDGTSNENSPNRDDFTAYA